MRYNRADTISEGGRILRLAWPIMLTSLNWTLMHFIDVAVVGHFSTDQLAALAASRALTFISIVAGLAILSGVLVFASRADGAGRREATADIWRSGLALGLAFGAAVMIVLLLWAEPMLGAIGIAPALVAPGAAIVRAMALAFPFQFVIASSSYFLEGISRPRRVMAVNLTMLPFNGLLAWAWVGGHFGLPARGAVGAASATAAVSAGGAFLILILCWTLPRGGGWGVRDWSAASLRRAAAAVPRLAWFGLVPGVAATLELAGFSWLMALSTRLGVIAAAAFQSMLSIHNLAFALSMGLGSAAGVRVGNAIGAGERDQAWPRALIAGGLTILLLGGLSILFVSGARIAVMPFSNDPRVISLAAAMLAVVASVVVFDGLQYVFFAALRSLGDQVWAGIIDIFCFFVVMGGLAWLLVRDGWGPIGLAYAAGAGMVSAGLLQFARLAYVLRKSARS